MFVKQSDDTQSRAASRILNISGSKIGNFSFPKRERFNEEIDEEILSQKSTIGGRVYS